MKDQTTQGNIREIIFKDHFILVYLFLFFKKPTEKPVFTFISVIFKVTSFFFFPPSVSPFYVITSLSDLGRQPGIRFLLSCG